MIVRQPFSEKRLTFGVRIVYLFSLWEVKIKNRSGNTLHKDLGCPLRVGAKPSGFNPLASPTKGEVPKGRRGGRKQK